MTEAAELTLNQRSQQLLDQLRKEQWEAAALSAVSYLAAAQQMMRAYQQATIPEEKQALALQLQAIEENQAEIAVRLQAWTRQLEQNVVRLQQRNAGCQDYRAQMAHGLA